MSPRITPSPAPAAAPRRRFLQIRPRVWVALLFLAALGYSARYVWHRVGPSLARDPHYLVTLDNIHITPPPPWIRTNIKADALHDAGLVGTLSVLDEALVRRVHDAFEFHPWIESVERITKRVPHAIQVELNYRRPVAAVESTDLGGVTFLPIDEHGIRLPEADLTDAERRYLPRISGVSGRPLVGDSWNDPRVIGGAKLALALADVWEQLRLVEIQCVAQPTTANTDAQYIFEIVTSGGTRIVWGAAPGQEASAGESRLDQKRQRILDYAAQHGRLETIEGPAQLDVRSGLVVTPRTARKKPSDSAVGDTQTAIR